MEIIEFNKLLLKTAFSCMACDGNIDKSEIQLIKKLHNENKTFGEININSELDLMLEDINKDSHQYMKDYFNDLTSAQLSESNELSLIEVAIETIKADEKIEYSEIKFFKVIRSKLSIDNDSILEKHPDFDDYLEEDIITDSYLARLQSDFLDTHTSNQFELISLMDDNLLDNLKSNNEE